MITLLNERDDGSIECIEILGTFEQELAALINRFSKENESDTPDFILADYIMDCLTAWRQSVRRRDKWYGHKTLSGDNDGPVSLGGEVPPSTTK